MVQYGRHWHVRKLNCSNTACNMGRTALQSAFKYSEFVSGMAGPRTQWLGLASPNKTSCPFRKINASLQAHIHKSKIADDWLHRFRSSLLCRISCQPVACNLSSQATVWHQGTVHDKATYSFVTLKYKVCSDQQIELLGDMNNGELRLWQIKTWRRSSTKANVWTLLFSVSCYML